MKFAVLLLLVLGGSVQADPLIQRNSETLDSSRSCSYEIAEKEIARFVGSKATDLNRGMSLGEADGGSTVFFVFRKFDSETGKKELFSGIVSLRGGDCSLSMIAATKMTSIKN